MHELLLQALEAGELQRLAVAPHGFQHQLIVLSEGLGAEALDGGVDPLEASRGHDLRDQHLLIFDAVAPTASLWMLGL